MALSREKILSTAFDLLTQYGLADLSMRRLAQELEVAPGALYYHVKNKQELLSSLASRMVADLEFAGETAQEQLDAAAQALYASLAPVREAGEVLRLALALHPEELVFVQRAQEVFEVAGLDTKAAALAAKTFTHVCISFLEEEQTRALLAAHQVPAQAPASLLFSCRATVQGFLLT